MNNRNKNDFTDNAWRTEEKRRILKPLRKQSIITDMITYSLIGIVLSIVVILIIQAISELWR